MENNVEFIKIVLIGNAKYDDQENISDLPNIYSNISMLERFFLSNSYYKEEKNLSLEILLDKNHYEIQKRIDKISQELPLQSRIIIYYSGHGLYSTNTGKYFLAARDSEISVIDSTSIDVERILVPLKKARAKEKILIVDACYSGKIHENLSEDKAFIFAQMVESAPGIYVATSTNAASTAKFDPKFPETATYFTQSLMDTVSSWKGAEKEFLTINEVFDEVAFQLFSKGLNKPVKTVKGDAEKFIFCSNSRYYEIQKQKEEGKLKKEQADKMIVEEKGKKARLEQIANEERIKQTDEKSKELEKSEKGSLHKAQKEALEKDQDTILPHVVQQFIKKIRDSDSRKKLMLGITIVLVALIAVIYLISISGTSIKKINGFAANEEGQVTESMLKQDSIDFANLYIDTSSNELELYNLRDIISDGFPNGYSGDSAAKQIKFIKTAETLGDYYYHHKDMYTAFKYYTSMESDALHYLVDTVYAVWIKLMEKMVTIAKFKKIPEKYLIVLTEWAKFHHVTPKVANYVSMREFQTMRSPLSITKAVDTDTGKAFTILLNEYEPWDTAINNILKTRLAEYAKHLRSNRELYVIIKGNGSTTSNRQTMIWEIINKIINYLVEIEGLGDNRFNYDLSGEETTEFNGQDVPYVSVESTMNEPKLFTVPPPHPNLRKK
jgi:hypothetical protein